VLVNARTATIAGVTIVSAAAAVVLYAVVSREPPAYAPNPVVLQPPKDVPPLSNPDAPRVKACTLVNQTLVWMLATDQVPRSDEEFIQQLKEIADLAGPSDIRSDAEHIIDYLKRKKGPERQEAGPMFNQAVERLSLTCGK
jgi:hypothetical protein